MFEDKIIKLRKLSLNDFNVYHNWRNDLDVMYSTSPALDVYTLEDTENLIQIMSGQPDAKGYIIEYKETGQAVGIISLIHIDTKNRSAECVIDIGEKDMWGKGIGKAALTMILRYAFDELNLHRVFLQVFSFNQRAINLYEKIGFKQEGQLRQALYRGGNWHDIIVMGILSAEYKQMASHTEPPIDSV
nr:GNAT family protein [uncultured Anaerocolumna sp.]